MLLLDHRRLSQHRPLGALSLPLGSVDLQHVLELWRPLGPPAAAEVSPPAPGSRPPPGSACWGGS